MYGIGLNVQPASMYSLPQCTACLNVQPASMYGCLNVQPTSIYSLP